MGERSQPHRLVAELLTVVSALEHATVSLRPLTEPVPERLEHVAGLLPRLGDPERAALTQATADIRAVANSLEGWSSKNTGRRELLRLYITEEGLLEVVIHHDSAAAHWAGKLGEAVIAAAVAVAAESIDKESAE